MAHVYLELTQFSLLIDNKLSEVERVFDIIHCTVANVPLFRKQTLTPSYNHNNSWI